MTKLIKYKLLFFLLALANNFSMFSYEFLYPVAAIKHDGKTKIYVLHQKSINNIELWLWDPETKECSMNLLSSYMPASLKILPDCDGFSFIDDGRIRIKKFNKRSPKSIDIYEPVYDISQLNWIDEQNFYISAKKNNKFCIFHVHENGLIKPILRDSENMILDFMYPQKVGNSLFFIERVVQEGQYKKEQVSYKIIKTVYPDLCSQVKKLNNLLENSLDNSDDFDIKTKALQDFSDNCEAQDIARNNCHCLADFKHKPIAFLNMISETEGFFLHHQENICKHDEIVSFDYFSLRFINNTWENKKLFSFTIPAYLILEVPDSCLYESILPLLPKYHDNKIYYVDFDIKSQNLNVFSCNLLVNNYNNIEQKSFILTTQLLFPPIFIDNKAFCGGKIDYSESCPIKMWINDENCICIDLIEIFS
jgi:hypothetical protein